MLSKAVIKHLRALQLKKFRDESGLFLVEGPKLVKELLLSPGWKVDQLYALPDWHPPSDVPIPEIIPVTEKELEQISIHPQPNRVIAVAAIPPVIRLPAEVPSSGLYLLLDQIQDPGNLGTIIRTADWFGLAGLFCSQDTVDCFNPKVVQSSMGSLFRIPVHYGSLAGVLVKNTQGPQLPVYATQLDGSDIFQTSLSESGLIILGNESRGIHPLLKPFVNRSLLIPSKSKDSAGAESLNVATAAGIVCAEFFRRFLKTG